MKSFSKFISYKGIYAFYFIFGILFIYSYFKKNRRLREVIWSYIKAQVVFSFLTVRLLKIILGRARPKYGSEFTFFSLDSHYNAFPSGHSADAFVSGIFLFYLLKHSKFTKYRFIPLIFALFIALSRIGAMSHFTSDVLAGTAIGIFGASYFIAKLTGHSQISDTSNR